MGKTDEQTTSPPPPAPIRTFAPPIEAIRVVAGEWFSLSLPAQPTAGYSWQADVDSAYLALEAQRFEPGGPALGAAGRERLVFRALQPGRCELGLTYGRPWEPEPLEQQTVDIEIQSEVESEPGADEPI